MSPHGLGAGYDAALSRAGFQRWGAPPEAGIVVYRRAAPGHWFLEARLSDGGAGHVDVGLAAGGQVRGLLGPVHRALSAAALASALPGIIASLESLAGAADDLRCPTCSGWPVMGEGPEGSFLACGQPGPGRNPFDSSTQPCRRHLGAAGLVVHGEPDRRGDGSDIDTNPIHTGRHRMKLTRKEVGERQRDYFLARSGQGDELLMEPFCWCGAALEQEYECTACNHKCRLTLILCADPGALAIATRLAETTVDFRQFEVAELGD